AITLATGRRLATVRPQLVELGITLPVILQSGAQIVDPASGAVLYCNPLPQDEVATAVRLTVAEGLQPILYENSALVQHLLTGPDAYDSPAMRRYTGARPDLVRRLPYDELAQVADPLELATIDDLPKLKPLAGRLLLAQCRTLISYSAALDSYFLEVFHASCSKGEALCHLTGLLGLAMSAVVAVGDNYNDREMLEVAGLGVAMANAEPEILAVADHVTGSNDEDGIATLVDELLTTH
ncbi:MAG TPA: HAD-IIB family hydrolase, partial [Chloroflexota bacterium]|nr:HAD-IIB family hydrolase [Chloroflexota bacterium]